MILSDWAFLLYAVYVPLLLALYLLELIAIFKHRQTLFNSSFYSVFSVLSVVNILACLDSSFVFRLPLYQLVNGFYEGMREPVAKWRSAAHSGAYYLNCLSEFLGVLLAFNRLTALYFPTQYEKLWRPRALLVGISLCLLLSIPPVNHIINQQTHFMKFLVGEDKHSSYWMLSDEPDGASIWFNIALVSVVCNSASFLLYGACLIRLCSFSKLRNSTAERNLFLVGVLTSIVTLPYMTAMASDYVFAFSFFLFINKKRNYNFHIIFSGHLLSRSDVGFDPNLIIFFLYQMPWLTDLKYLSPAPMLIITNRSMRKAIIKTFRKPASNAPVVFTSDLPPS